MKELIAPIEGHTVAGWIKRHDPVISCLREIYLRLKETHTQKVKGQKVIVHASRNESWSSNT